MVERIACGRGDFAVGRNFSAGDGTNDAPESGVARLIFAKRIFQNPSLEVLRSNGAHGKNCIRISLPLERRMEHPSPFSNWFDFAFPLEILLVYAVLHRISMGAMHGE